MKHECHYLSTTIASVINTKSLSQLIYTPGYIQQYRNDIIELYSPIGSALECEATVLRSIHSSGELRGALRGPTTCSDPVGIMD